MFSLKVSNVKVMNKKIGLSIAWAPFYASLAVISALGLFIGVFWAINEYQAYMESVDNIRENYQQQYQSRVEEEIDSATAYVQFRLQQDIVRSEGIIRDRVQVAYTIASHIYRLYKDEKTPQELREMVTEILRPIRWASGHGYYFAGRLSKGHVDLFADEPALENRSFEDIRDIVGTDVMSKVRGIVREKGAGFFQYDLIKPNSPGKIFSKLAFVKYFEPFDWFIGAGVYRDDLSENVQQEALSQLENMTFAGDGEVFAFRFDGTIICSRDTKLLGRSILSLKDSEGYAYGEELWRVGIEGSQDGFVTHGEKAVVAGGKARHKLTYVRAYPDLKWVFGATMYMDSMEDAILKETETYQRISFRNVAMFIVLFIVAVFLLLFSTYVYSLKIKRGIQTFTDFFRSAADSNEKVRDHEQDFIEFEGLAHLANKMIDQRMKNELLLHRDELRLDALLRLGMMDSYTLQDKYDFILERIVQITGSEEGYIALVNDNQSHLTFCSCVNTDGGGGAYFSDKLLSATVQGGGVAGRTVMKKTTIVNNRCRPVTNHSMYPYKNSPKRHLDVPIYNNGKIVVVAGVCNSSEDYGNPDIRQMTMLLEGMWLHVIKTCAEEEKLRLERQIITVSEEERNAIGRDLHDDLCSHLSGVELLSKVLHQKLDTVAPDQATQLGTIRDLIRDAIDKTRRLSHGLYPVHIVEYGLEAAIEELVVEVENMFRVSCVLDFQGQLGEVDSDVMLHLYYVVRESVFNAARHGKPQSIHIEVYLGDDFLIRVEDDGCGFDAGINRKGIGFYTMEYRARMLGAHLEISSEKEKGTLVIIAGVVSE